MKKLKAVISILLSSVMILSFANLTVGAESSVLTQNTVIRAGNTYYINNFDDLKTLSILVNEQAQDCSGATFELTADINFNKGLLNIENGVPMYGGAPISEENAPVLLRPLSSFKGTFDGKGYRISGIYSKYGALFDNVDGAVIKNTRIVNSLYTVGAYAGAFCGVASNSTLSHCSFSGIIIGSDSFIGGIVGAASGSLIEYCKNDGYVKAAKNVGGIAGMLAGSMYGSCNTGTVIASNKNAGGLAGTLSISEQDSIKYCCSTGSVSAGTFAGGFAGDMYVEGDNHLAEIDELLEMEKIIDNFYNDGNYHTAEWPPGALKDIIDFNRYSELSGIVNNNAENIRNCYAGGTVESGSGKSHGSVCGNFNGCAWNFVNCYVNILPFDSIGYLSGVGNMACSVSYNPQSYQVVTSVVKELGVDYCFDDHMKTEAFLKKINAYVAEYIPDGANENNGYPLPAALHDESLHIHNFTYEVTREVTCLISGLITYTCECGETYTETIPAKGHMFVMKEYVDSTCTENGYEKEVCRVCGSERTTRIDKKGHDFVQTLIEAYNCQTGGSYRTTCQRCGYSYVTTEKPWGHMYNHWIVKHYPSLTTKGITYKYCDGCDDYIVEERELGTVSSYQENVFFSGMNEAVRAGNYIYFPVTAYYNYDFPSAKKSLYNSDDLKLEFNFRFRSDIDGLEYRSVCFSQELLQKDVSYEITEQNSYIDVKITFNNIDDFTDALPFFSVKFFCPDSDVLVQYDYPDYFNYTPRPIEMNRDFYLSKVFFVLCGEERHRSVANNDGNLGNEFITKDGLLDYIFNSIYTKDDINDTFVLPSIESVDYEKSDSPLNDYTFMVNGKASKIAFLFKNNSTATYTRDMANIKSFDKDGNEVPQDSNNIDYELWTIHRTLKANEEIKVRAKYGKVWEDEYYHFKVELKRQDLPLVESVTYEPSFSAENDYVLKVNCIADKVQFINPNGTTATYTKSSAKSVVSYNKNGSEVEMNSKDTAYEIWTIHRTMKTGCEMFVHVKTGGKWESETKAFIVELKKKDVSSIESVTWNGEAVSKNDYYIKVNGKPDKIAFINPNGSTATYTRNSAEIKSYDANDNEVSPGSKNISYEIWTINRSMKTNAEMRVRAKFGSVWEAEMFSFTVK